jgi:hypothetical protein
MIRRGARLRCRLVTKSAVAGRSGRTRRFVRREGIALLGIFVAGTCWRSVLRGTLATGAVTSTTAAASATPPAAPGSTASISPIRSAVLPSVHALRWGALHRAVGRVCLVRADRLNAIALDVIALGASLWRSLARAAVLIAIPVPVAAVLTIAPLHAVPVASISSLGTIPAFAAIPAQVRIGMPVMARLITPPVATSRAKITTLRST